MEYIKVQLDNRVLTVPAEDKDKYIQQGYTAYDDSGKVIGEPNTDSHRLEALKNEHSRMMAKYEELEKVAAERHGQIEQLNAAIAERDETIAAKDAAIADLNKRLNEAEAKATAAAKPSTKASGKTAEKKE